MALEEFTVEKNTAHIPEATADTAPAVIDELERRALAQVATVKETGGQLSQSEAKVYGELAVKAVAPGLELVSAVTGFLSERNTDLSMNSTDPKSSETAIGFSARTIDDDISGARRPAGVYRAPPSVKLMGDTNMVADSTKVLSFNKDSAGLLSRAGISASSLNDQPVGLHGDLKGTDTKLSFVQQAQKLTTLDIANKEVLESVHTARMKQSATPNFGPNLGLGSGPTFRNTILSEPPQTSMRDENSTWSGV